MKLELSYGDRPLLLYFEWGVSLYIIWSWWLTLRRQSFQYCRDFHFYFDNKCIGYCPRFTITINQAERRRKLMSHFIVLYIWYTTMTRARTGRSSQTVTQMTDFKLTTCSVASYALHGDLRGSVASITRANDAMHAVERTAHEIDIQNTKACSLYSANCRCCFHQAQFNQTLLQVHIGFNLTLHWGTAGHLPRLKNRDIKHRCNSVSCAEMGWSRRRVPRNSCVPSHIF